MKCYIETGWLEATTLESNLSWHLTLGRSRDISDTRVDYGGMIHEFVYRSGERVPSSPIDERSSRTIWRIINIFLEDNRGNDSTRLLSQNCSPVFFLFKIIARFRDTSRYRLSTFPEIGSACVSLMRRCNSLVSAWRDCESTDSSVTPEVSIERRSCRPATRALLRASSWDFYYSPPLLITRDLPGLTHMHHGAPLCPRARVNARVTPRVMRAFASRLVCSPKSYGEAHSP